MSHHVRHAPDRSRYELVLDGEIIGHADYRDDGDALVFPHTVVDPRHRGKGNGDRLVQGALDDVRSQGRSIVPSCWFVREFVDLHPGYADLLADR